jgi:hypothetical protein
MQAPPALKLNGGSQIGFVSVETGRYYITQINAMSGQLFSQTVENVQFNGQRKQQPRRRHRPVSKFS